MPGGSEFRLRQGFAKGKTLGVVDQKPLTLFLLGSHFLHSCHCNGQIIQLLLIHHVWAVHHEVGGVLDLGEGDESRMEEAPVMSITSRSRP